MKKLGYLGLLSLFLFGCSSNSSSVNSTNSSNMISSSSSETQSSSTSLQPVSYKLTDEMLDELNDGYRVEGFYNATVKGIAVSSFYYEYNCTSSVYEYTAYEDNVKNPTKDKVVESYRYESYTITSGVRYLTLCKLNLNNEVMNYFVTDGVGNLQWDSTGFGNVFSQISSLHFEKSDKEFEFNLKMNSNSLKKVYPALTSQFSSYMGLTAKSFTLITNGYKIVGYRMTYQPIAAVSGMMDIVVEGKFTKFGSDVVQPVVPFEGAKNDKFDNAFKALRNHSYKVDIELGVKAYDLVVENGRTLVYDEFNSKGKKVSSYGFNEIQDGILQGITKINDVIYEDGGMGTGKLSDILPILKISSELFVLVEETNEKSVFKYNDNAPEIQSIGFNYDYGIFGGSKIGDLTISILDNEVIIENDLQYNTETFRYYDINNVAGYFSNIQKSTENLKWSDVLSNQEEEVKKLYDYIPKEVMDLIPVVGENNARVDLDATYKPQEPVIAVPPYIGGEALFNNYKEKLLNSGFVFDETLSTDGKEAFFRNCEVNGESKKLIVKIYLAQDYLAGSQFLIYPSLI